MAKKHSKNLQRVQDMLDDNFDRKIQSGYTPDQESHKVGDKWTDSDGVEWEQKDGYRSKVSKINVGIFSKTCKTCEKPCTKSFDVQTYNRMGKCYDCQVKFELDLSFMKIGENNNKHYFWVKLQQLVRWEMMEKENEMIIEQKSREKEGINFDKSVANAVANANLDFTVKKNS